MTLPAWQWSAAGTVFLADSEPLRTVSGIHQTTQWLTYIDSSAFVRTCESSVACQGHFAPTTRTKSTRECSDLMFGVPLLAFGSGHS